MLRVSSLLGNSQRLDGGAMFGNAPRALWQRWCLPDDLGRIALSCRSFLVEDGHQRILLEAGVGAFFDPSSKDRYGVVESEHVLLRSLARAGLTAEDIDVVVLSHLHFDHAGGLLSPYSPDAPLELAFPNARIVVGDVAWRRAKDPHPRDRASFIQELPDLLERSGRLEVVPDGAERSRAAGERLRLMRSDGHTPGMLLSLLEGRKQRAIFCADLVPGAPWVHLPITMGYDRYPELLIDEKREIYEALGLGTCLLFTHDPTVAAGFLSLDDRGRYSVEESLPAFERWDLDADG